MIVEPDFPDHWKTQMLVDLSKDDSSPLWILRLWAHAQQRRAWTFDNLPPAAIKAVTKAKSHRAEQIVAWLEEAGFICRDGLKVVLLNWEEYNKGLIASWGNGAKGGRPKKTPPEPTENPPVTGGLPTPPLSSFQFSSFEGVDFVTEDQAREQCLTAGVDPAFGAFIYADWFSREGKDAGGVKCSFIKLARKRWNRERTEWEAGVHSGQRKRSTTRNGSEAQRDAARTGLTTTHTVRKL